MKHGIVLFVALVVSFALTGCDQKPEDSLVTPSTGTPSALQKVDIGASGSGIAFQPLYAGQSINAGKIGYDDIDTDNDGTVDALAITYATTDGWELVETHFFIGNALADMPTTRSGNPQIGLFPFKSGTLSGQTSYTIIIPFAVLGFSCPGPEDYFVAAHASLRKPLSSGGYQTETGWGDGQRLVQRGNWAMYNVIFITCDETKKFPGTTETAFAFGETYAKSFSMFPDFIENDNRWGWTNGPLANGSYSFPIYAGAAQSDISKGTLVGRLTVNYGGPTATVTYTTSGTNPKTGLPYSLEEVHLYVGNEPLPRNKQGEYTIAPGQYPKKAGDLAGGTTTYTFTVNNLSGSVYVVAHAVVYGFPQQ